MSGNRDLLGLDWSTSRLFRSHLLDVATEPRQGEIVRSEVKGRGLKNRQLWVRIRISLGRRGIRRLADAVLQKIPTVVAGQAL